MNLIHLLLGAALVGLGTAEPWHLCWDQPGKTWSEKWASTFDSLDELAPDQQFLALGAAARIGNEKVLRVDQRQVTERARSLLLSIPGHAEFFAKRIKAKQKAFEDAREGTSIEKFGLTQSQLLDEQMYGFATLKAMPSPETVRVLGEFLYDPWGLRPNLQPGENQNLDEEGITSHSSRALSALAALPLTYKPVQPREYGLVDYHQDIDAWKLWYEQVRAGTRTFRFVGDPREYNLQGPVASAVEPTAARQHRPADDTLAAVVEESPRPIHRGPIIGLFVALLLLVAAAWRVFRSRREGA